MEGGRAIANNAAKKTRLNLLLLEDSTDDATLLLRVLKNAGYEIFHERVENRESFIQAMESRAWDAVIADYSLPRFTGIEALEIFRRSCPDVPFLVVSGTIGEETAVAAMRAGANDYLLKDHLARLIPALERELREAENKQAKRAAEESRTTIMRDLEISNQRFRMVSHATNDVIWDWDIAASRNWHNENYQTVFGLVYEETLEGWKMRLHPEDRERVVIGLNDALRAGQEFWTDNYRFLRADGKFANVLDRGCIMRNEQGLAIRMVGVMTDTTERKRAEEALVRRVEFERLLTTVSRRFINLTEENLDIEIMNALEAIGRFAAVDRTFLFQFSENIQYVTNTHEWCSHGIATRFSRNQPIPVGAFPWLHERVKRGELTHSLVSRLPAEADIERQRLAADGVQSFAIAPLLHRDTLFGAVGFESVTQATIWSDEIITMLKIVGDILSNAFSRKSAERDRLKLEEQLRQSQKIEAIGQLAGGVAHDFNNILMAISGYCELLLMKTSASNPLVQDVIGIQKAAEQGVGLSRQLLAFSRKQVLVTQTVKLDEIISNLEPMVRRLIREDIELIFEFEPALWSVMADPVHVGQAIINLVVNARDAMPNGGTITLRTANETLDKQYEKQHIGAKAGDYVLLKISDTGTGMDEATRNRIFEPFFTTKEQGKGTGLGLSTVYGIVQQSGGYLWVDSEVNKGTVFYIYLPRAGEAKTTGQIEGIGQAQSTGSETILVVDDNEAVRNAVGTFLELNGYEILRAADGEEALTMISNQGKTIDLLITDVVMPKMSGRELAQRMSAIRDGLRVLYMSGYTDEPSVREGNLGPNSLFLQKPTSMEDLLRKVRQLLEQQA